MSGHFYGGIFQVLNEGYREGDSRVDDGAGLTRQDRGSLPIGLQLRGIIKSHKTGIGSGSVAEEASDFERTGPRFESYSGRSLVRRTDYPVAGTFKLRKPEMAGQDLSRLLEPEKKKKTGLAGMAE
uniref:Uncharacterized protein n=1 Tax=Anopheles culicifacies TaxID=139723 RepID=A0A182M986_9DIPT